MKKAPKYLQLIVSMDVELRTQGGGWIICKYSSTLTMTYLEVKL